MLNIIISLLTFVLILVSLFMVLVILMQRANTNSGMGSAFGGGVTESAFGADTTNILTKATKWSAVAFFVIALTLYLMYMSQQGASSATDELAPPEMSMTEPESPAETVAGTAGEATVGETGMEEAAAAAGEAAETMTTEAEEATGTSTESPPSP